MWDYLYTTRIVANSSRQGTWNDPEVIHLFLVDFHFDSAFADIDLDLGRIGLLDVAAEQADADKRQ